jgi:signal transduction histidine kinase
MMANQDKLAMIGEVTAGITHDLNTPLSSILLGSENLRETLELLLNKTMQSCSVAQLQYAIERSANSDTGIFISGLQAAKNIASIEKKIHSIIPGLPETEIKDLARAFNKAKVKPDETEVIEFILNQPNQLDFINLIYEINNIRFFLNTIHQAAERSSGVIKNLRYYLKEGSSIEKTQVHIKNSFKTVLSIFNHEIQKGIEVHLKVPDSISIEAYESKIYQLWSNIIKNAIDAMNQKGNLYIEAKEEKKQIHVKISNDGPMIPAEIREKIFDKFFTTKDEVRGTGLGLNIVKQVIDEHRGKISVSSDERLTSFQLILPKN